MSKSKGNLVAPSQYFDTVGADALRLYHLFIGPPADDVDWGEQTDEIIDGASRFLHRVWRLAVPGSAVARVEGEAAIEATRATHRLIGRVSDDADRWSYNTAVAALMEFTNLLYKQGATEEAVDTLLLLLAPMTPHITAELWDRRHPSEDVHAQSWPQADPDLARLQTVTMIVQVNGKVRDRIEVDPGIDEAEAERLALDSPAVREQIDGSPPKKIIAKPPRLVNVVV